MKNNLKTVTFLLVTLLIAVVFEPKTTNANSGHLFTGGFSSASSLTYQVENAKGTSSYFINAAKEWAKLSTKVSMTHTNQNIPANLYFRDAVNGPPGSYGLAVPYYKNANGSFIIDLDTNKTWNHVNVFMYVNNMSGFTYEKRMFIALHEIGHALSLAHNNTLGVSTVMRTNLGVLSHTSPKKADKNNLQLKWGN